jgi:hypothetical protein
MTTGHFTLFSTMGDADTRQVARQLQGFEQTFGDALRTGDRMPDTPTLIYLIGARDFNAYLAPRPGLGGFFVSTHAYNLMVINADEPFKYVRVAVLHEFVHYVQRNTSTMNFPPWYMEGNAELFSGFDLTKDRMEFGKLPYGVHINLKQWIPVERLLAVKQSDPEYQSETLAPQFYGEAWALVHYLFFDDKTLLSPTSRYLDATNAGVPEPEAFASSFPFDKAELDQRLRRFVAEGRILVMHATLPEEVVIDALPITRIDAAESAMMLTRLALRTNPYSPALKVLAAELSSERPSDPAVRALCARIAAHGLFKIQIDDLADRYAAGGSDDAQVRIDIADALLTAPPKNMSTAKALAMLSDLIQGDTPNIEAVELWMQAAERTGTDPRQIIAALEPVRIRAPHDTAILRSLARAAESAGNKEQARGFYNEIILVSSMPGERLWAQKQADSRRLQH